LRKLSHSPERKDFTMIKVASQNCFRVTYSSDLRPKGALMLGTTRKKNVATASKASGETTSGGSKVNDRSVTEV